VSHIVMIVPHVHLLHKVCVRVLFAYISQLGAYI
jgi:hypothetical protein